GNSSTAGKHLPQTPQFTGSLSATYRDAFVGEYEWYAGGSYAYRGNAWDNENNLLGTGAAHIVNVRAGLEKRNLRFEAFITNLLDDDTLLSVTTSTNLLLTGQNTINVSFP